MTVHTSWKHVDADDASMHGQTNFVEYDNDCPPNLGVGFGMGWGGVRLES